jgi:hypothetical protein
MSERIKKGKVSENLGFLMNKQGSAFALSMVIFTWILVGFTWYCFSLANAKIDAGVSSVDNLTKVYDSNDRLSFYLGESARLSANQAYYKMAQEPATGALCFAKPYNGENIIQLTGSCRPDRQAINERFLSEYNKSFSGFIEKYPEKQDVENMSIFHSMENDTVLTTAKKTLAAEQKTAYASYSLSYDFYENLATNLSNEISLDDFTNMYDKSASALDECRDKEIEKCVEEKIRASFENWDFDAVKAGTWVLFEFKAKKPFFFENETERFEKIGIKFGIAL